LVDGDRNHHAVDEFKGECITIFGAIEDRCTRENDFLFPLAETGKRPPLAA
jgi:hypothetical protein